MPVDLPAFGLLEGDRLHVGIAVEFGCQVAQLPIYLGDESLRRARISDHVGQCGAFRVFLHGAVMKSDFHLCHGCLLKSCLVSLFGKQKSPRSRLRDGAVPAVPPTFRLEGSSGGSLTPSRGVPATLRSA